MLLNLKTMNKETRTFIWGLILLIVCGVGFSIHINDFINGTFEYGWNWLLFGGTITGTVIGGIKVSRTTD